MNHPRRRVGVTNDTHTQHDRSTASSWFLSTWTGFMPGATGAVVARLACSRLDPRVDSKL
jgi:hypothetical protein